MDIAFGEFSLLSFLLDAAFPYAVCGGAGYLAWRYVRAFERRGSDPEQLATLTRRVCSLEDAVDEIEARVDRSDDLHRFTTSVLAGRAINERDGRSRIARSD